MKSENRLVRNGLSHSPKCDFSNVINHQSLTPFSVFIRGLFLVFYQFIHLSIPLIRVGSFPEDLPFYRLAGSQTETRQRQNADETD